MRRVMSAALVVLCLMDPSGFLIAQSDRDVAARVDKLFVNSNRDGAPGLAIAIVRDGRVLNCVWTNSGTDRRIVALHSWNICTPATPALRQ